MKISDVYLNLIKQTEEYSRASSDKSRQEIVREQYRIMARKSEELSSALAHCVAFFGDLELEDINFQEMEIMVKGVLAKEYWYLYTFGSGSWSLGFEYLRHVATLNRLPDALSEAPPYTDAWLNVP